MSQGDRRSGSAALSDTATVMDRRVANLQAYDLSVQLLDNLEINFCMSIAECHKADFWGVYHQSYRSSQMIDAFQ